MQVALGRDREVEGVLALRELAGIDLRALDGAGAEQVCDRIAATGAPERVRAEARERVALAKAGLEQASLPAEELMMLATVADGVVERYS